MIKPVFQFLVDNKCVVLVLLGLMGSLLFSDPVQSKYPDRPIELVVCARKANLIVDYMDGSGVFPPVLGSANACCGKSCP